MSGIIKGITIIYLSVPDVVISCAGFPILLTSKTTTGDIYIPINTGPKSTMNKILVHQSFSQSFDGFKITYYP